MSSDGSPLLEPVGSISGGSGCRVVLAGLYGVANLGDEIELSVFIGWVRAAGGTPLVISVHPDYTRRFQGAETVGYADLAAIVEAMADADLVVIGGGGLFQDYDAFDMRSLARFPAWNVSQFAQFFCLARELALPVAVLGQGVGPLRGSDARAIAADVFNRANVCSVRDAGSAALLRTIGVSRQITVAPDPAWSWPVPEPIAPRTRFPELAQHRVVAMVVRDWPFDCSWEAPFVAAMRETLPRGWALLWLDFTRVPDASAERPQHGEIADRLIPQLPGMTHVVWEGMRVEEAAALIAGCDAVIAMRLHGAVLGHLGGLPVVALEYDAKVRALNETLGVPLLQRVPLDAVAERLPAAVRCVTDGQSREPFRLDTAARARLAIGALAHRALLRDAMAAAARAPVDVPPAPLLPGWISDADDAVRRRIVSALVRRLASVGR